MIMPNFALSDISGYFDVMALAVVIAVAVIAVVAVAAARMVWHKVRAISTSLGMTVLLVQVPRELGTPDKPQELTAKDIQEQLGVADQLWSTVGGLRAQHGFRAWLRGRTDHVALELVVQGGQVSFYVAVPSDMRAFIEQQVQAYYPHALVEQADDYNLFPPSGAAAGAMLNLSRPSAFGLKTYRQFEADPMGGIITSLSKVAPQDAAAVQLVVRSARRSWRREGVRIASEMQQGKSLSQVSRQGVFDKTSKFVGDFLGSSPKKKQARKETEKPQHVLTPQEAEMVKGIEEKASKAGLDVTCRVVAVAQDRATAEGYLEGLVNSFSHYSVYQYGNRFIFSRPRDQNGLLRGFIHRLFEQREAFVLNTEELASLYHFPVPGSELPNVRWLTARKAPPPQNVPADGIVLGINEYRGAATPIRMARADRARHFYVIGKSGTGKSVFLQSLAVQDIAAGQGVCVIDPHGDLVDDVLARIPASRADDVIIFDPTDTERPQGLNLLEYDARYPEQKTFVINEFVKILEKLYDLKQTGGPMFEQYLRNALLLLMEDTASGATLMEVSKVLADPEYRKYKLSRCHNPVVYDFWVKEAQKAGGDAALANMVPYITSKLNQFVANDFMRPIIGQQVSAFNFRSVMDERKILLVRLSKGKLGDLNAYLLGLVIVGKILMAALSRTDVPQDQRKDFYLYIDEFQNFITDSISVILSEARKYRLNLTVAHQYIGQLVQGGDTRIRDSVFGNVGTIASFRVGVDDAEFLAKEFAPVFTSYDLINIELFHAYLKLLINNTPSRPFNLRVPPPTPGNSQQAASLREMSRSRYGRPRDEVEREITERATKLTAAASSAAPSPASPPPPAMAGTGPASQTPPVAPPPQPAQPQAPTQAPQAANTPPPLTI